MRFEHAVACEPFILAEGAVIERLRRDPDNSPDPHIAHAGFIYQEKTRSALEAVYRGYLDIGLGFCLPMIVLTPTWRANPDRLARAGFAPADDVNGDCARFMARLIGEYGAYADKVLLGGLMGPAGDAYDPGVALSAAEAGAFHWPQALALAEAGIDFLMGATLPALSEALGMAEAMAACGLPYVLSFVLRPTGSLLDGTPLHKAICRVDSDVDPSPICYLVNCVHPTVFEQALDHELGVCSTVSERVIGLQANTSPKPPEELDNLAGLESQDPETFAEAMVRLYDRYGIKVLGGCCGTDDQHIASIARRAAERLESTTPGQEER